jgi:hypothetical protein
MCLLYHQFHFETPGYQKQILKQAQSDFVNQTSLFTASGGLSSKFIGKQLLAFLQPPSNCRTLMFQQPESRLPSRNT